MCSVRLKSACGAGVFLAACAGAGLPLPQRAVERWYSTGVYPPLQRVLTRVSNLTSIALLDVLLVCLPIVLAVLTVREVRQSARARTSLVRWTLRIGVAAAAVYLVFLLAWGLNYRRVPLEQRVRFDARGVTSAAARDATRLAVDRLNALYVDAHASPPREAGRVDAALAAAFADATMSLGASGRTVPARPKHTLLDVYFRPAAVAGMTDPFFLETLVESDLLPVERPFVIAHEWSHLAGFADEGEANFAGWLTCIRADAAAQYSGWLFLFDELASGLPRGDRADAAARLQAGPRADLRAIAARLTRDVKPHVSVAGWRVYDRFLKANRVDAGAASYAQVVRLVLGTRMGITDRAASPSR